MPRQREPSRPAVDDPRQSPADRTPRVVTRLVTVRAVTSALVASILVTSVLVASIPVVSGATTGSSTAPGSPAAAPTATVSASPHAADQIAYVPASVSITAVGPADNDTDVERPTTGATIRPNETTVVRGETNLRPDDNAVVVELRTQNGTVVAANATDEWGTDGAWSTILNTSGAAPDTYTLEVEAADSTDRIDVEVVQSASAPPAVNSENGSTEGDENGSTVTATVVESNASTTATGSTEGETGSAEGGETDMNETGTTETDAAANETADSGESDASTPGFGFVSALVSAVAVAVVASMRGG